MKLASFIDAHNETILVEWDNFAASLGEVTETMTPAELRDHAHEMLAAISRDMRTVQSASEQADKSRGLLTTPAASGSAASSHGAGRHGDGFQLQHLTGEFRALRSSVLRLWLPTIDPHQPDVVEEVVRFNESIDQAIAESVAMYARRADHARDMFLAILSHDLRSPLQAIGMTASALDREDLDPGRYQTSVARIRRSTQLMTAMVNDLMEFSRLQLHGRMPIVKRSMDLTSVCAHAVRDVRAARPTATIDMDEEAPVIANVDEARLLQLLSNLLNNACQYSTKGSAVTLDVQDDGPSIRIDVHNKGPTIPADALDTIFSPMVQLTLDESQVERPRTSVGLGLFIARHIAEAHGGSIGVASSDQAGTTFSVRLPRA